MEDFVPFEIAKKLKEKGFKEKGFATYTKNGDFDYNDLWDGKPISYNESCEEVGIDTWIDAPTISQVLKWMREEKGMHIVLPASFSRNYWWEIRDFNRNIPEYADTEYSSYEQAALAGIEYVLDNLI